MNYPKEISQFRPISLCKFFYKLITKIMVNKLKGFINKPVSINQCDFIIDRQGANNVILLKRLSTQYREWREKKMIYGN